MKKVLLFIIGVAVVTVAAYFVVPDDIEPNPEENAENPQRATFSNAELGIAFEYRTGPNGYVLKEATPPDPAVGLMRVLTLFRTEDASREVPQGGEGPMGMAIVVFKNLKQQTPRAWADEFIQYSNINLKMGEVTETTVDGAPAIRYMADGLYASENAVITEGEHVYYVIGQFMDQDSDIRRDFAPLLDSIRFIP